MELIGLTCLNNCNKRGKRTRGHNKNMILPGTHYVTMASTTLGFFQEEGHHQILDLGLPGSLTQHELFVYDLYNFGVMLFCNRKCISHTQKWWTFGQVLARPWWVGTKTKEACTEKLQSANRHREKSCEVSLMKPNCCTHRSSLKLVIFFFLE